MFPAAPGVNNVENILQIFTVEQTGTASATPDFEDNTLLAAGYYQDNASSAVPSSSTVVFDNTTFNQDIYITQRDISNGTPGDGTPVNYYIELEQIKLDLNENTVATLKDIRNIKSQ